MMSSWYFVFPPNMSSHEMIEHAIVHSKYFFVSAYRQSSTWAVNFEWWRFPFESLTPVLISSMFAWANGRVSVGLVLIFICLTNSCARLNVSSGSFVHSHSANCVWATANGSKFIGEYKSPNVIPVQNAKCLHATNPCMPTTAGLFFTSRNAFFTSLSANKMTEWGYDILKFQIHVRYRTNELAKVTPPSVSFETQLLIESLKGSGWKDESNTGISDLYLLSMSTS